VRALLSDRSAWQVATFEDEAEAPPGLAELAPAW
jgi:UDP-3-O-[3-hydroxymyristoyl] N-acetylglucosamine deacetylase